MTRPGWIPKTCTECHKAFMGSRSSQLTCSRLCRDHWRNHDRRLILARDCNTCVYCSTDGGKAKARAANFLRIIRVNPQRKATAQNLVTVCLRCARNWEGVRLPRDREERIVTQNKEFNQIAGIDNAQAFKEF